MNAKTLKESLPYLFACDIVPLIVGYNGIGKTHIPRQYAAENKLEYVEINIGELESQGDLLGLQTIKDGRSEFMLPQWWPKEGTKGILVLDELTRARPDMLQGIFRLLYGKKLHVHELPKEWNVMATANPDTDDFIVTQFDDKAFMDRVCFIKFQPSIEEFLQFAREKNTDFRLLNFLSDNQKLIEPEAKDFQVPALPSRRTYLEFIDKLIKMHPTPEVFRGICFGLIGVEATIALEKFMLSSEFLIKPEEVVYNYSASRPKIQLLVKQHKIAIIGLLVDSVIDLVSKNDNWKKDHIQKFLCDVPKDIAFATCRRLFLSNNSQLRDIYVSSKELQNQFLTEERQKTLIGA